MSNVDDSWNSLISELNNVGKRSSEGLDNYLTVRRLFENIQKLALYDENPMEAGVDLVHYTTWSNALHMFNDSKTADQANDRAENNGLPILRMYNYEQSNDPDEGRIKLPEWEDVEKKVVKFVRSLNSVKYDDLWIERMKTGTGTYGCSFSSGSSGIEDDLTYWRLYGNDGKGCSLKISNPLNGQIYKVRYRDKDFTTRSDPDAKEDQQVAERLNKLLSICEETVDNAPKEFKDIVGGPAAEVLFRTINSYYHLVKHVAYKGENEWRMINVMPKPSEVRFDTTSKHTIKRYVKGAPLSKLLSSASIITIGPTVPNRGAARAYIEHLVTGVHDIRYVTVKNSKQTYRQTS